MSILQVSIPVPTSGDGASASVADLVGPKTVQLAGNFRGTYDLLGSHDDVKYVGVLSFDSGTASGVEGLKQTITGSFKSFKLRAVDAVALGTVTCTVSGVSGVGENHFAQVASLLPGHQGLSAIVDTAALFPPTGLEEDVCFICCGGFRGQVVVLGSMDGVRFNPVGSFKVDVVPEGSPVVFEFAPLSTVDKVRYLRVSASEVLSTTTITVGGRISTSTPGGVRSPITLSAGRGSLGRSFADAFVAESILADHEWLVDFSQIVAATVTLTISAIVKSNLTDAHPVSFRVYVGSTTPGNTVGGSVVASLSTSSAVESDASATSAPFARPGAPCLVQVTSLLPNAAHVAFLRATTIDITG